MQTGGSGSELCKQIMTYRIFSHAGFPGRWKAIQQLITMYAAAIKSHGSSGKRSSPPQAPSPLRLPSLPHAYRNRLSLTTHHTSTIATLILRAELHQIGSDLAARGTAICTRVSSRPNLHIRLVFSWSPAVSTVMALSNMSFSPGRLSNSRVSLGSKLADKEWDKV